MYEATKSNSMTESEARKFAGDKVIDALLKENCEFSNRVIDDVYEVEEMSGYIEFEDSEGDMVDLRINYLVSKDDLAKAAISEDLGDCDYSNYSFEVC